MNFLLKEFEDGEISERCLSHLLGIYVVEIFESGKLSFRGSPEETEKWEQKKRFQTFIEFLRKRASGGKYGLEGW